MEKPSESPAPAQPSTSTITPPSTVGEEPSSGGLSVESSQPPTGDSAPPAADPAAAISDVPPAATALAGSGEALEEAAVDIDIGEEVTREAAEAEEVDGAEAVSGMTGEAGPVVREDEAAAATAAAEVELEVPGADSVAPTTTTCTSSSTSVAPEGEAASERASSGSGSSSSQPADHPGTLKSAALLEVVTTLQDAEAGTPEAVGTASGEDTAGAQVPEAAEEEGGKGKLDGQGEGEDSTDSTDATSGPTDDDGSDSWGGGGGKDGKDGKDSKEKGELDYDGEGEGGAGIFANPAWRWGGIAALVGAVLVVGLRRR